MSNYMPESVPTKVTAAKGTSLARELFTRDFWITGLAILKYVPRSFRVQQVEGMTFFAADKQEEFRNRVLRITSNNPRQWGTMSLPQMLHHLNLACGSPLGFYTLPDESYLVSRTLFRWILIDWYPEQAVGLRLPRVSRFRTERSLTSTWKRHSCSQSLMLPGKRNPLPTGGRTPCSEK